MINKIVINNLINYIYKIIINNIYFFLMKYMYLLKKYYNNN